MNLQGLSKQLNHFLKGNSPTILAGIGASGVISTAYLSWKAGYEVGKSYGDEWKELGYKERIRLAWRSHIPATASGALAIGAIAASTRIGSKRTAALSAAYAVSERAFDEYRRKVVEQLGAGKEQKIRDGVAQDVIRRNPPGTVILGSGHVLCCELFTGRYFNSDMQALRKAENDINAQLYSQDSATLNDLYYILGLPYTSESARLGWKVGKPLKLDFSVVLSDDDRPCIAFSYNYVEPV